ncbi:MAG: hypothetical protein KBS59_05810 [Clostridiales bacterium]|nr:hypothetical protein [Clostridiales bacterium]
MPLYQPTFITPSTLTGTGTVVLTDNVHFSWQVNGNVPMTAFKIEVYTNNAASTLVHASPSSGYHNLDEPFYGADASGRPVRFTFEPEDETWDSWGLDNYSSYKFKITMLALGTIEAASRVVQYSESVFYTKDAPTVSISNAELPALSVPDWRDGYRYSPETGIRVAENGYSSTYGLVSLEGVNAVYGEFDQLATICFYSGNDATTFISSVPFSDYNAVSEEYPDTYVYHLAPPAGANYFTISKSNASSATYLYGMGVLNSVATSFTGTVSYSAGDSLSSVRWVLENMTDGRIVKDTGKISTPLIAFDIDELSANTFYKVYCTIETGSGLSATASKIFFVDYSIGKALGGIEIICNRDESVTLSLPEPLNIPGTPSDPSILPPSDGYLTLASGESVTWGDGDAPFPISDYAIAWKGLLPDPVRYLRDINITASQPYEVTTFASTRQVPTGISDTAFIASSDSGKIKIWGVYSGGYSIRHEISGDFKTIYSFDFSADGKYLLAGGYLAAYGESLIGGAVLYKYSSSSSRYTKVLEIMDIGGEIRFPGGVRSVKFQKHTANASSYVFILGGGSIFLGDRRGYAVAYTFSDSQPSLVDELAMFTLDGAQEIDGWVEDVEILDGINYNLPIVLLSGEFTSKRRLYSLNIATGRVTFLSTVQPPQLIGAGQTVNTAGNRIVIGRNYYSYDYTAGLQKIASLDIHSGEGVFNSLDDTACLGGTLYAFIGDEPVKITDIRKDEGGGIINSYGVYFNSNLLYIYDLDAYKVREFLCDRSAFNCIKLNGQTASAIRCQNGTIRAFGGIVGIPQFVSSALISAANGRLSARYFNSAGVLMEMRSAEISDSLPEIETISAEGAQTADLIFVTADTQYNFSENNYTPFWSSDTLFLADFENGFQAGTVSTSGSSNIILYRESPSGVKRLAQVPTNVREVTDYGIKSNVPYKYSAFYASNNRLSEISSSGKTMCRQFKSYTLIEASTTDGENYKVLNVWNFAYNMTPSSVSNNNSPNWLSNFTPYPMRQRSTQRPKSGVLSGLLGKVYTARKMGEWQSGITYLPLETVVSNGIEYYAMRECTNIEPGISQNSELYWSSAAPPKFMYRDTAEDMEKLYGLVDSIHDFFIRDTKGNLYLVGIDGAITQTVNSNSSAQEVSVSIPWRETGSAQNVSIVKTVEKADNGVLGVRMFPDAATGELFAEYPSAYKGTTFSLN